MKLARILIENVPTILALEKDGSAVFMGGDMLDLIGRGLSSAVSQRLDATLVKGFRGGEPDGIMPLCPLPNPGKVIAIGLNYMDHIREQNATPPKFPLMFSKFSSSVIGPDETIRWNPALATEVDFEAELAVIIGKTARHVAEAEALNYVFGYTAANDVTARDLQKGDGQWTRAKGLETFCPLGPFIVTADEIPDPQNLWIKSTLNGQVMQNGSTKEMLFGVAHLIAYISQAVTLHPGDVILTGTPDGVGVHRKPKILMKNGDEIIVEIEKIGALRNRCAEDFAG